MYLIVKFFERNDVAVVPKTWFRNDSGTCFWPLFKSGRLTRAVVRAEDPQEDWTLHDATVLRTYGTYDEARVNLSKVVDERTDDSDADPGHAKRRRLPPRRFSFEESQIEDDSSTDVSGSLSSVADSFLPPDISLYTGNNTASPIARSIDLTQNDTFSSPVGEGQLVELSGYDDSAVIPTVTTFSAEMSHSVEFEKNVTAQLTAVHEKIDQLNRKMDKLLRIGLNMPDTFTPEENPWTSKLPFYDCKALIAANAEILGNAKSRDCLIMALAEAGGTDCKSATRFMMKKLLSYQVAAKYSWIGQKGKDKFSEFVFPDIILRALKVNRATKPYANEKDVKDYIMDFLKHSKEKLTTRKNSGLPQTQRENSEVTDEEDG